MKNLLQVSTEIDKPELLVLLVEKLAMKPHEHHSLVNVLPKPWMAFETSSVESYLTGTMNIALSETDSVHVPFIAGFLFCCRRENQDPYKFEWGLSMS